MNQNIYDFLSGLWMIVCSLSFLFIMIKVCPFLTFIPSIFVNIIASIILLTIVLLGLKVIKKVLSLKSK